MEHQPNNRANLDWNDQLPATSSRDSDSQRQPRQICPNAGPQPTHHSQTIRASGQHSSRLSSSSIASSVVALVTRARPLRGSIVVVALASLSPDSTSITNTLHFNPIAFADAIAQPCDIPDKCITPHSTLYTYTPMLCHTHIYKHRVSPAVAGESVAIMD